MPPSSRPSAKELCAKLRAGLDALNEDRIQFVPSKHLVASLDALALESEDALIELLKELITDILSSSRILEDHYAGGRPPQPSYEPLYKGQPLWAFKCPARSRGGQLIYLKFVLKQDVYFHVSCHEDDP